MKKDLQKLEYGILDDNNQNIKFFLIAAVFDKPARAEVLNVVNSYGNYGCLKCHQKGERIKKDKSNYRINFGSFKCC